MLPAAQNDVAHDLLVKNISAQIKDISQQIKQLSALKIDLLQTKRQLQREGPIHNAYHDDHFIHRCAHSECNGFVSSAWKCATCDKYTCSLCREPKKLRDDADHVCNPDSVASVALLKTSTKPCPNCKVLVHKTEGCDQMFCTQCKRLWSWNTGQFETRGHNPHYLQWMRENHPNGMPRDPNDVQCGREIEPIFLYALHRQIKAAIAKSQHPLNFTDIFGAIFNSFSSITHLWHHDLHQFPVDRIQINLHARKAFVSNQLSTHKFKQITRRNHLIVLKNENITQILQAVIQAVTDIAFRFQHHLNHHLDSNYHSNLDIISFALELFNLRQYANHELAIIYDDFHTPTSKRYFISATDFKLETNFTPTQVSFQDFLHSTSLPKYAIGF